eukprot:TRINITY_DN1009_c0_g1_i1.p1 TRINITY_DN1009_c0_g1~~TRINITY_DN1009_c0_g1_i1.p1  ORF type:complete len:245 (-),score=34.30 TRINITY_DN1009_c0_g1_i1:108-842(-)
MIKFYIYKPTFRFSIDSSFLMEMNTQLETDPSRSSSRRHSNKSTFRHCSYCNKACLGLYVQRVHIQEDNNEQRIVEDSFPVSINSKKNWELLDGKEEPLLISNKNVKEFRIKVDGNYFDSLSLRKDEDTTGRSKRKINRQQKAQLQSSSRKGRKIQVQESSPSETSESSSSRVSLVENDKEYCQVILEGAYGFYNINYDKINTSSVYSKKYLQSHPCCGDKYRENRPSRASKRKELVSFSLSIE